MPTISEIGSSFSSPMSEQSSLPLRKPAKRPRTSGNKPGKLQKDKQTMAKAPTPLERIRQLEEQKQAIMAEAKAEALATATAAVDALNELGFSYRLTEGAIPRIVRQLTGGEGRKGTRQVNAERPCPICNFKTAPPHDARRHRSQGDNKKPFTAEELSGMGLRKA